MQVDSTVSAALEAPWCICIGLAFRALHFQSPAPSYVLPHPAISCQDVETEKGDKIDATRMNEIMSKCLAAGQADHTKMAF